MLCVDCSKKFVIKLGFVELFIVVKNFLSALNYKNYNEYTWLLGKSDAFWSR